MKNKKIYIAGHKGMVGSSIQRSLKSNGYNNLVNRSIDELDLINQSETEKFFRKEKPEIVIVAAAKVGGILANNTYRAEFLYNNLMIESNIINSAHNNGVEKLIFLGSSCIYPKYAAQPINEKKLLTGELEYTNEPYAIAKIAGIKLCENYYKQYGSDFYSVMPTNLFGPGDNFDLKTSHVLPALLSKIHTAKINGQKSVEVWGSGKPKREFLYVDDLAKAIIFLMEHVSAEEIYSKNLTHINIGTGKDLSISELAELIIKITGYAGEIKYDTSKPDGTPRKLLDVKFINQLGWQAETELHEGIKKTYDWYLNNIISRD